MDMNNSDPDWAVSEGRVRIRGWPTDTLAIDRRRGGADSAHTLLLFVPGNPGVVHWYADALARIVRRLGRGHAVRGVSYAGHGVGEDVVGTTDDHERSFHDEELEKATTREGDEPSKSKRDMSIPWTMDGQVEHKIEWLDRVLEDWRKRHASAPDLVFISHSIGAHLIQCMLLRRPDILEKTRHVVHLMPFIRFAPPLLNRLFLSTAAQNYKVTIPMATTLVRALSSTLPRNWVDVFLEKVVGLDCAKGRSIALDIFLEPNMAKNHFVLGMQEVREIPEHPNDVVLRLIGAAPTSILFCGGPDQWAPEFHMEDLRRMQRHSMIPSNIHTQYIEEVRHDFVVHPDQIEPVVDFCVGRLTKCRQDSGANIRSRL